MQKNVIRNQKIIDLIAIGLTYAQIAKVLGTSYRCVYSTCQNKGIAQIKGSNKNNFYAKRNKQIIESVKHGLTYIQISEKFNLSYSCVQYICKKYNIHQLNGPKRKCAYPERNKKIFDLIKAGLTYAQISKELELSYRTVYYTCASNEIVQIKREKKSDINLNRDEKITNAVKSGATYIQASKIFKLPYQKVVCICIKENIRQINRANENPHKDKIIELIKSGLSYEHIAPAFGITKQRVQQIAKASGVNSIEVKKIKHKKEIESINSKVNSGECYVDVYGKYKNAEIQALMANGLTPISSLRKKRNKKIISAYKNGTSAKTIIENGVCGIQSINSVYNVVSSAGSNRYPNLIRNKKGYSNENIKILRLIKKLKNQNKTISEITKYLNDHNYKSVCGKSFSYQLVNWKYKQSLTLI